MHLIENNSAGAATDQDSSAVSGPQLELAFAAAAARQPTVRGQRRISRATWWFQRMRQAVDRACDWQPARAARPEQIWLPNTYRSVSTAPALNPDQRQICE
jgi:hypothetical protein